MINTENTDNTMKIYEVLESEDQLDEFWPALLGGAALRGIGGAALRGLGALGRGALRSATRPIATTVGGAAGIASRAYGARDRFLSLFQFLSGSVYFYILYEPLGRYLDTIAEAEKKGLSPEEFEKIHHTAMKKLIAEWANIFISGKLGKYAIGIFRPLLGRNSRVLDALTPASQIAFIKGLEDTSVAHEISAYLATSMFGDVLGAGGRGIESIIKGVIHKVMGDTPPDSETPPKTDTPASTPAPTPSQGASQAPPTDTDKSTPKARSSADTQYLNQAKKDLERWKNELRNVDDSTPQLAAQIKKNITNIEKEINDIAPEEGGWEYYAPGYKRNKSTGKIEFDDPGSQ
jgi:hypothetical protein